MTRKTHLKHTSKFGPVCQAGHSGARINGEHFTGPYSEFVAAPADQQCAKCKASKLFAFLERQAGK
jgi:hypothetical protein